MEREDKQMAQEIEDEGGEEGEDEGGYGEETKIDLENDSSIQLTDISDYRKKNFV